MRRFTGGDTMGQRVGRQVAVPVGVWVAPADAAPYLFSLPVAEYGVSIRGARVQALAVVRVECCASR